MNFDFSKLSASIQYFLIGMAVLMPVFYLDLYLYHKGFLKTNPQYIAIIASYCLSFGWLIACMFMGLAYIILVAGQKNAKVEQVIAYGNAVAFFTVILGNLEVYTRKGIATFDEFLYGLVFMYVFAFLGMVPQIIRRYYREKKKRQLSLNFPEK